MLVDIIPLLRLPKKMAVFTYLVPSQLEGTVKVGQMIETTFRGRKIQGLVKEIKSTTNVNPSYLKPITKITNPEALFTPNQFKLADWICDYYVTSLALVIKSMIPKIPRHKVKTEDPIVDWSPFKAEETKAEIKANSLLRYSTIAYHDNFIFSCLAANKKQTLILVPEINDIGKTGRYIKPEWREKTVIFHSNLNKNQYLNNWLKIISGEAKIIIGTRPAVFLPFSNLGLIIIEEENDSDFKQWDQNPRYDARTSAQKLAELTGAKLLLTSSAPRLETYFLEQTKKLTAIAEEPNKIKTEIINLKDEMRGGNYSLISEELSVAILEAKSKKQKAVLYLNRRGLSSAVVCGDCAYTFNCPHCLTPLPYHQGAKLKCHHCGYEMDLPATCPNCHGAHFKFPGRGTQLIEKELQQLWAGCKILRLDADVDLKKITAAEIEKADVYLGTDLVFKKINWEQIGLVGVLSMDNLLHLPSLRASERLWQALKRLEVLTTQSQTDTIFLQTFNPDNKLFYNFRAKREEVFYREELADRQELAYPPYSQLIKLIYQSANQKTAEYEANDLYRRLTKIQEQDKINAQINEPQLVYTTRVRGRFRYVIIIKTEVDAKSLLKAVPETWLIDIDPDELL